MPHQKPRGKFCAKHITRIIQQNSGISCPQSFEYYFRGKLRKPHTWIESSGGEWRNSTRYGDIGSERRGYKLRLRQNFDKASERIGVCAGRDARALADPAKKIMNEKTKTGLKILQAAVLLGVLGDLLLRRLPWGLNAFVWFALLVWR